MAMCVSAGPYTFVSVRMIGVVLHNTVGNITQVDVGAILLPVFMEGDMLNFLFVLVELYWEYRLVL